MSRYKHVESRKKEGAHYTPEVISDFISSKIISNFKLKDNIKIVDPAIGDGELLISLIKQLYDNSIVNIEVNDNQDLKSALLKSIQSLSQLQQMVIRLFYVQDYL